MFHLSLMHFETLAARAVETAVIVVCRAVKQSIHVNHELNRLL